MKIFRISVAATLALIMNSCQAQPSDSASLPPHPAHHRIRKYTDSGHHYARSGDTPKALFYHKQALGESRNAGLQEHEARSLSNIAKLLQHQSSGESLQYLYNALHIARSIKHHELQADIYSSIAAVYKQQQNYREALEALEQHHRFADTLIQKNKEAGFQQLKASESRKKERTVTLTILCAVLIIILILAINVNKIKKLNRQLSQSVEIRDKLFSILAHDLRGPAGNMTQALSILIEDPLPEHEKKLLLQMLLKQSRTLSDTLESLLLWSKNQLDGAKAKPVSFKAAALANRSIALLNGQTRDKSLTIHNNIPEDLIVFADADHFELITRNLLSNAVKFSHEGGNININAVKQDDAVIFSVTDNGIGINAENLRKFDENHMQARFGTSGEKGTGIGLPLVKDLVSVNKGRIWVKSEENKGATFSFSLPALSY